MLLASSRQAKVRPSLSPLHGSWHGRLGMTASDSPPFPKAEAQKTSYVGQSVPLAAEYHESDFDWHAHAKSACHVVMRQEKMAAAVAAAAPPPQPNSSQTCMIRQRSLNVVGGHGTSSSSELRALRGDEPGITAPLPPPDSNIGSGGRTHANNENHWEVFYQQHAEAKFYKLRRYILKVTMIQSHL